MEILDTGLTVTRRFGIKKSDMTDETMKEKTESGSVFKYFAIGDRIERVEIVRETPKFWFVKSKYSFRDIRYAKSDPDDIICDTWEGAKDRLIKQWQASQVMRKHDYEFAVTMLARVSALEKPEDA